MVIKEISKIIIDAENGTLRFDDVFRSLRDCGAVKFIYDQKTDAELCIAFVQACERMIGELHYDGIYPVLKQSVGDIYMDSKGYEQLKDKTALVDFLKGGTKNQLIIEMPRFKQVDFSLGEQKESGKEWVTFSDVNYGHTLTARFFDFAVKYNNFVDVSKKDINSKNNDKPTM